MNRVTVIGIFILLMPWIQLNAQNNEQDRKQVREFLKAVDALSRSVQTHSAFQPDFRSWLIQQPEPRQEAYYEYNKQNQVQVSKMDDDQADTLLNQKLAEDMKALMKRREVQKSMPETFKSSKETGSFADSVLIRRLNQIPTSIQYTYNQKVKRFIELYLKERRKQVAAMAGLARHYFPIFERVLDMQGLPLELKYLPIIESALNPTAYSRAGASGLWQFMHYTGKLYDLEINTLVDERRDPLKSTYAAARHLEALYDKYKTWSLVIAAYNCGQGRVDRAIRRTGKHDFWDIYYYLPRETRGYVPAFIAVNYVMNYYDKHGIQAVEIEMPDVAATVDVHQKLHLKQLAGYLDLELEYLKELNPQYRYEIIPAGKKTYKLRLPKEAALEFAAHEDSIYTYKQEEFLKQTRKKQVTSHRSSRRQRYNPPDIDGKAKVYYRIKTGDNIGFIAEWFNVRASDIRYWNNLRGNRIIAGKKLLIYVPEQKADYYRKFDRMSFAQKQKTTGKSTPDDNTSRQKSVKQDGNYIYYTIKQGDNLWTIAKKFQGVSNLDIKRINNFTYQQVQHLKPGMVIKIKKKS